MSDYGVINGLMGESERERERERDYDDYRQSTVT